MISRHQFQVYIWDTILKSIANYMKFSEVQFEITTASEGA